MLDEKLRDPTAITLPLVFLIVIGSFLGTSIFARHASSEIADVSERLATNVSPSIEDLASVRGSVLEAELALASSVGCWRSNRRKCSRGATHTGRRAVRGSGVPRASARPR